MNDMNQIRKAAVKGFFYPASQEETFALIKGFQIAPPRKLASNSLKGLIVPHAGIIYSGKTAKYAYSCLRDQNLKNVLIVAVAHRVAFRGMSLANYSSYQIFDQEILINQEINQLLKENFKNLDFVEESHRQEHSAEVQLPFLLKYLGTDFKLNVILHSRTDYQELAAVIDFYSKLENSLVIISTDLSHFYPEEIAREIDNNILEGVKKLDLGLINRGEACGLTGLLAMITTVKKNNWKVDFLDYSTSGEVSKDRSNVVGYVSYLITN